MLFTVNLNTVRLCETQIRKTQRFSVAVHSISKNKDASPFSLLI